MSTPRLRPPPGDPANPPAVQASCPPAKRYECDACGGAFEGVPGGSGLFIWTRGEETRFEEPPLCEQCAEQLTLGALALWQSEADEEG